MQKQVVFDGQPLSYRLAGTGAPILLLHGFGEDSTVWRKLVPGLAENYQLILPDLPGTGSSPVNNSMRIEGLAEAVHAIIHEEGMDACPVIGHSMGGYVALALAEAYPNHVSALGLFHSTAYSDSEEKKEARRKAIALVKENGALPFLKKTVTGLFSKETRDQRPALVDEQLAGLHNFSDLSVVSYYQAMIDRPDRTHVLKTNGLPVLFIIGEYDEAVSPGDSLRQSHLPEISYIHVLQHSAHLGMLEEAGRSLEILEGFLRDVCK